MTEEIPAQPTCAVDGCDADAVAKLYGQDGAVVGYRCEACLADELEVADV